MRIILRAKEGKEPYVIEVRRDILNETDGPMLRHGLQEIAGQRIHLPRDERLRPQSDLLEERYAMFRKAG